MVKPEAIAAAQAAQKKWGVPASVSLAQYAIESDWGTKEPPGSNNGLGIQALPGLPSVASVSFEYRAGKRIDLVEHFAKFVSVEQCFDKHGELLATNRAYRYAMAQKDNPRQFAHCLQGVYETAPGYDTILIRIMDSNDLYQYDVAA